jgi:hypothetical protein
MTHTIQAMDPTPSAAVRPGRILIASACVLLALAASGCNSGSRGGSQNLAANGVSLRSVSFGRLTDVYAFRRLDESITDRRVVSNREAVLVLEDVVVDPSIETQPLIDPQGDADINANYRVLPYDPDVGHTQLLILWDDRIDGESERFDAALQAARTNLTQVPGAFRGQVGRPVPVIPRDAALLLEFNGPLGVPQSFFQANPSAAQLLLLSDDPVNTTALSPLPARIIARENTLVIDPTISGAEVLDVAQSLGGGINVAGLPPSLDSSTANIRVALPIAGSGTPELRVAADSITQFNGLGANGEAAVIRDFRASNLDDSTNGRLPDTQAPALVADAEFGIVSIDPVNNIVVLDKRGSGLAVRGRIPFVDGARLQGTQRPSGIAGVPTRSSTGNTLPLPAGDVLSIPRLVLTDPRSPADDLVVPASRFEILEVLEVNNTWDGTTSSLSGVGLTAGGTDGGELTQISVRLPGLKLLDANGQTSDFTGILDAGNADCSVRVRYYEFVPYRIGAAAVSDSSRRNEFLEVIGGNPQFSGSSTVTGVSPDVRIRFQVSEPLDPATTSSAENVLITNAETGAGAIADAIDDPKRMSLTLLASQLLIGASPSSSGPFADATSLEVFTSLGLFHEQGTEEDYWLHLPLGESAVRDLAGNTLRLFDERPASQNPVESFSVRLRIDATAADNFALSRVIRFASADEDGTAVSAGAADYFGQFQIRDGNLIAAPVTRRRLVADQAPLSAIERFTRGECFDDANGVSIPSGNDPPQPAGPTGSLLYLTPAFTATQNNPPRAFEPPVNVPQQYGGSTEPFSKTGSRMMLTYREDDFGLDYTDPGDLNIDVEQLHWASWANQDIEFDVFNRISMSLAHSQKRPDLAYEWSETGAEGGLAGLNMDPDCRLNCKSLFSGLSLTYDANILEGTTAKDVVVDRAYSITPAKAFTADSGTLFHPYPDFEDTYTWRDSRLVDWDPANQRAVGLGGAVDASGVPGTGSDATASISSPWVTDDPINSVATRWISEAMPPAYEPPPATFVRDVGDFLGDRTRDHDPIALPLLIDIKVYPEDLLSGDVGTAANELHIALVGNTASGGYYGAGGGVTTLGPFFCTLPWPAFRIHTTGGFNPTSGQVVEVDPDFQQVATSSIIKNMGLGDMDLGLTVVPPGDGHVPWAAVDLVRRVSVITSGFFDTLEPHRNEVTGVGSVPNLSGMTGLRASTLLLQLDPPLPQQPAGTSLDIEFRGADTIAQAVPWDPFADDALDTRGNLLNPHYASEAYRYNEANLGFKPGFDGPRVPVQGITRYVGFEEIDEIKDATGRLPRYLNFRLSMGNDISSTPFATPFLRSMAIEYRLEPNQ